MEKYLEERLEWKLFKGTGKEEVENHFLGEKRRTFDGISDRKGSGERIYVGENCRTVK